MMAGKAEHVYGPANPTFQAKSKGPWIGVNGLVSKLDGSHCHFSNSVELKPYLGLKPTKRVELCMGLHLLEGLKYNFSWASFRV